MFKIFFPDWIKVLVNIDNGINISKLTIKSKVTFSYCCLALKEFEKRNFITTEKIKNDRFIYLTEYGKETQDKFLIVYMVFK